MGQTGGRKGGLCAGYLEAFVKPRKATLSATAVCALRGCRCIPLGGERGGRKEEEAEDWRKAGVGQYGARLAFCGDFG